MIMTWGKTVARLVPVQRTCAPQSERGQIV